MSNEVLIIGSQRDYCNIIKEFLELRDTRATLLTDYKTGIDRLFEEKPALSVIEIIERKISPSLIAKIRDSNEFSMPNFTSQNQDEQSQDKSRVLLLDETKQINYLFDYLKANLTKVKELEEREITLDEGSLNLTFYPFLLIEIYRSAKTGILSISSESELKIYFKNGSPVYAEGNEKDGLIGNILLNSGRIDPETHRNALVKAKERNVRVGEVLIEAGIITPHELNNYLELQIEEKILRGIFNTSGDYSFREEKELSENIVEHNVKLAKVLNEAVKRYVYAESIEDVNPKIRLAGKAERILGNMELKPKELRLVQLLKNHISVKEILSETRLEKNEALKLLYLLCLFQAIELPGVSLESIGRKSVERYLSEHKKEAELKKDADTGPDSEQLMGLDPEVNKLGKGIENRPFKSPETTPADVESPEESASEVEENTQEPSETAGTSDIEYDTTGNKGDTPGFFSGNEDVYREDTASEPELELQKESAEEEPPEEIPRFDDRNENENEFINAQADTLSDNNPQNEDAVLNPAETEKGQEESEEIDAAPGSQTEESVDDREISLELKTSPEEITAEFEEEIGAQEPGPDLTAQDPNTPEPETEQEPLQQTREGISVGNTELFSTFENNENASEEPVQLEEQNEPASFGGPNSEAATAGSGEEFTQKIVDFHNSLSEKDNYEILGVSSNASLQEIKDSYYQLVKDYHPDVNHNIPEDISEKAQEIFTAINSAYETLSDSEKRKNYDSQDEITELKTKAQSIYEAEIEFKRGHALLKQRDYNEAAAKFAEALDINPAEAAYIGACAWARYLASEDKTGITDEMIEELRRAIDINSSIAENYYYLGSIYKNLDDIKKAEQNYEKAVNTDPNYIEAKRELRLINTRKRKNLRARKDSKIEKRFWSGLFKK